MSEGTLTALVRLDDQALIDDVTEFVASHTDGVKTTRHAKKYMKLIGSTFDSKVSSAVATFTAEHLDAGMLRITHSDETGAERFWVVDQGVTKAFSHDQGESSSAVVLAYKTLHDGLGNLWLGALSKKRIEKLKRNSPTDSDTSNAGDEIPFDITMVPQLEKACLKLLQMSIQSRNLAEFCKKREIEEHESLEEAISRFEAENQKYIDKGREIVAQGYQGYPPASIKKYLDNCVLAAFNPDKAGRTDSALSFSCGMVKQQIEAMIEAIPKMNLWE